MTLPRACVKWSELLAAAAAACLVDYTYRAGMLHRACLHFNTLDVVFGEVRWGDEGMYVVVGRDTAGAQQGGV